MLPWPRWHCKLFLSHLQPGSHFSSHDDIKLIQLKKSKLRCGSINHRLQGCCLPLSSPQPDFSCYVNVGTFYRALAAALPTPRGAHPSPAFQPHQAPHTTPAFHRAAQHKLKGQPEDYKYLEWTTKTTTQAATTESKHSTFCLNKRPSLKRWYCTNRSWELRRLYTKSYKKYKLK